MPSTAASLADRKAPSTESLVAMAAEEEEERERAAPPREEEEEEEGVSDASWGGLGEGGGGRGLRTMANTTARAMLAWSSGLERGSMEVGEKRATRPSEAASLR